MTVAPFDLFVVAAYVLILLVLAYTSYRKESAEGFLIADRKLSGYTIATSICAGFLGGGFLVIFVGMAFTFGFSALWMIVGQCIGLLLFARFGSSIKKRADKKKFYTLTDFFFDRYNKKVGFVVGFSVLLFFLAFLSLQFIAAGLILNAITNWGYVACVLLVGVFVLIYTGFGGYRAVMKTDVFQLIILLLFLSVIGFGALTSLDSLVGSFNLLALPPIKILSLTVLGLFFVIVGADVWQRAYAAQSVREMKRGFQLGAALLLIVGIFGSIIGIAAHQALPETSPNNALVVGFTQLLAPELLGFGLIMLLAAIMSTIDTLVFVAALALSHDLVSKLLNVSKKKQVLLTRLSLFALICLGILVSLTIQNLINFAFIFTAAMMALGPVVIWSVFGKLRSITVLLALLITPLVVLILALKTSIVQEMVLIALAVSFVILIIGNFLFGKRS